MKFVAKTCASAKVAMLYIEYLGHKVTGRKARGKWRRAGCGDGVGPISSKGVNILDIGQTLIRTIATNSARSTEQFRQCEGSEIVIEYEATQADIDGDGDPVDQTDPGGIDAATQAVEAAREGEEEGPVPPKYPHYRAPDET